MRILRIYNNNVVLASDDSGSEAVMIGRGLAFGMKKGQPLDPSKVEQTFVPEAEGKEEQLATLLAELPSEVLALATELEKIARNELGLRISHSFVIPLADHLNFAMVRAREGVRVDYPLAIEVEQLYPRELAFGRRALAMVADRLDVVLPEEEATPLALHLVNAQFSTEDLSRTFRMTEVFAEIFEVLSTAYGKPVDRSKMSVARFVTHLRYLFVRAQQGRASRSDPALPAIREAVRTGYPRAFACAYKIKLLLEMHLDQQLADDEHTYLTIHIARLTHELWGDDAVETAAAPPA